MPKSMKIKMSATKRSSQTSKPQRFQLQHQLQMPQMRNLKSIYSMLTIMGLLLQAFLITPIEGAQHPVNILSNSATVLGQMKTSSTLVWESYDPKDVRQLPYAVQGGNYTTEDENYPIYVCRVYIDGLYSNGYTEKRMQTQTCIAGHKRHDNFEVLINKGHLGKLYWKPWSKMNAGTPIGAIRFGDENVYIARHRTVAPHQHQQHESSEHNHNHHHHNHQHGGGHMGADYILGRLESEGFGKIKVIEANNEEKYYEEGEVLVETQPFRYELRDIVPDKIRMDKRENITELASSILMNRGNEYSVVETVMSYQFDYIQNWGQHEGTARGLPTKIYEKVLTTPVEVYWGLKYNEKRYETKSVHTKLWPGTALNVTLKGKYVTLMAPYKAKLIAFYYGIDEIVSRQIQSDVTKSYLEDVKLEFSPVYFIENGTFVPTTTTTSTSTTSTTSTTTRATTTTTGQPKPINEPPIVHVKNVGDQKSGPDSLDKQFHDNESPSQNEIPQDGPDNLAEQLNKPALAGISAGKNSATTSRIATTNKLQKWSLCTSFITLTIVKALNI